MEEERKERSTEENVNEVDLAREYSSKQIETIPDGFREMESPIKYKVNKHKK